MSAVSFDSGGARCAGVHLPGQGDAFAGEDGRRPCVVLAHGFAGTVDSGLRPFAERFAAAGLDALAFDYRHFGASEGEPRQLLSIPRQLEDYAAAIAFARSLQDVDADRIVLWGSSFSGGHVVAAAAADARVAAAISQVPGMDGAATLFATRTASSAAGARFDGHGSWPANTLDQALAQLPSISSSLQPAARSAPRSASSRVRAPPSKASGLRNGLRVGAKVHQAAHKKRRRRVVVIAQTGANNAEDMARAPAG